MLAPHDKPIGAKAQRSCNIHGMESAIVMCILHIALRRLLHLNSSIPATKL